MISPYGDAGRGGIVEGRGGFEIAEESFEDSFDSDTVFATVLVPLCVDDSVVVVAVVGSSVLEIRSW